MWSTCTPPPHLFEPLQPHLLCEQTTSVRRARHRTLHEINTETNGEQASPNRPPTFSVSRNKSVNKNETTALLLWRDGNKLGYHCDSCGEQDSKWNRKKGTNSAWKEDVCWLQTHIGLVLWIGEEDPHRGDQLFFCFLCFAPFSCSLLTRGVICKENSLGSVLEIINLGWRHSSRGDELAWPGVQLML